MTGPQEDLETVRQTRDNAIRLLTEQAKAMQLLERENTELRKVLGVAADMRATVDQVQRLTAADFRVRIERVT